MSVPSVHGNRAWCFTLNNPTDEETASLPTSLPSDAWPSVDGLVYQLEKGENGTPHFQGYVHFQRQTKLAYLKQLIPRAHFEPARGRPRANLAYCTKDAGRLAEPVVLGKLFDGPGDEGASAAHLKRSEFIAYIAANPSASTSDIINHGGLEQLAVNPTLAGTIRSLVLEDCRRNGFTLDLYFGAPGCGKSRLADHLYPDAFRKNAGKWYDGYGAQQQLILDDFDADFMPIGDLLRLVDRYPLRVEIKGGSTPMVANTFIITSNHLPSEWYPHASAQRLDAIYRRIRHVVCFHENHFVVYDAKTYFDKNSPSPAAFVDSEVYPWVGYNSPGISPSTPLLQ